MDEQTRREAIKLWRAWSTALADRNRDDSDFYVRAEQTAYDTLVDYVEAHDLNYTEWDPRGQEDA